MTDQTGRGRAHAPVIAPLPLLFSSSSSTSNAASFYYIVDVRSSSRSVIRTWPPKLLLPSVGSKRLISPCVALHDKRKANYTFTCAYIKSDRFCYKCKTSGKKKKSLYSEIQVLGIRFLSASFSFGMNDMYIYRCCRVTNFTDYFE